MAEVKIDKVSKKFGDVIAIKDLSLVVNDGEFLTLLGPSGCGKTTLLNCIAGLEEVTEGHIYIDGQIVNSVPPKDRGIAMVFQDYALYPHMTVYQNLAFPLKAIRLTDKEIRLKIIEVADILKIGVLLNRLPRELSGGQRQRVALGRAVVRNPKVFLMDEPLSNIDARLRLQMRSELKKLHRKLETTIIYVTHDQAEAMALSNRIVILKEGILQQIDSPLKLYDRPANKFIADFLGALPMNLIQGSLKEKNFVCKFECGAFWFMIPNKYSDLIQHLPPNAEVIIGFRPEDILVTKNYTEGSIQAKVDILEHLGSDQYAHLQTHDQSFIARIPPQMKIELQETVCVSLDGNKIHIFDGKTEKVIL